MKRITLLIVVASIFAKTYAQAEPSNYSAAMAKFKRYYNANHTDSIFSMFSKELKAALPFEAFGPSTDSLKAHYGNIINTEFVSYGSSIAQYKTTFEHSIFMLNLSLTDDNRLNGVFLRPYMGDEKPQAAADPDVSESPYALKTLTGIIAGTLTMPANASGKVPIVVIVADAGPTDRDGNNEKTGITCSPYKTLAHDLAKNGIATLRYDKRLVGESRTSTTEKQLRIDDYSDDASSLADALDGDQRFSKIILFGHGEGALAGMIAVIDHPYKGYIAAECSAEQADKLLLDKMKATKPQYQYDEFKAILDSLRKGKFTDNVDPSLYYIAGPNKQNFLMSWCRLIPTKGIKGMKIPAMIIQGTTDIEVPADNGQRLKKVKSDAVFLEIKGMNHIFKDAPADEEQNLATYTKQDVPLSSALVPGIVAFVNKVH